MVYNLGWVVLETISTELIVTITIRGCGGNNVDGRLSLTRLAGRVVALRLGATPVSSVVFVTPTLCGVSCSCGACSNKHGRDK